MSPTKKTNTILAGSTDIPGRNILTSLQPLSPSLPLHITLLKRSSSANPHTYGYQPSPRNSVCRLLQTLFPRINAHHPLSYHHRLSIKRRAIASTRRHSPLCGDLSRRETGPEDILCKWVYAQHPAPIRSPVLYLAPKIDFTRRLAREAGSKWIEYCTIVNAGDVDYVLVTSR
jgi:hypothetical protein